MVKRYFILLVVLALAAPLAQADTIHLKNGSVLKGKVSSFADEQFIIMLDTGSGRYQSRAMVFVGDVARIEFEGAPAGAADGAMRDSSHAASAPASETVTAPVRPSESPTARAIDVTRDSARATVLPDVPRTSQPESKPSESEPSEAGSRQPDATQPEKPTETKPTKPFDRVADPDKSAATVPADTPVVEAERPAPRRSGGPVRTASIDVIGKRDWTSTGMIVKRGDRIRINATGAVTIDPVSGRTSGPEGTTDLTDPKKLMPDQPTGALIGVIGADNDDFIAIGKSTEFTATRDGLLFLSVNEGNLSDNVGAFKAVIEVQSQKRQ